MLQLVLKHQVTKEVNDGCAVPYYIRAGRESRHEGVVDRECICVTAHKQMNRWELLTNLNLGSYMFIEPLNDYFRYLHKASLELEIIETNLSVYAGMKSFDGTTLGAEQAAKTYIEAMRPRIIALKLILNKERNIPCQNYQSLITLKTIKFPSKYGHMK